MAMSTAVVVPASTRRTRSCRHVPKWSIQAATVYSWRPRRVERQLGRPAVVVWLGHGQLRPFAAPGGRWRSRTLMWSWPSGKASACTRRSSPTTRLTSKRPPSTAGSTRSMTTRRRPSEACLCPAPALDPSASTPPARCCVKGHGTRASGISGLGPLHGTLTSTAADIGGSRTGHPRSRTSRMRGGRQLGRQRQLDGTGIRGEVGGDGPVAARRPPANGASASACTSGRASPSRPRVARRTAMS